MDPAITSLMTIAGSGIAAYYGAYFKKRGEDKAIEDNFSKLLAQSRKTTEATKAIEAKISSEVWDKQKRWELKREVLFQAARRVAAVLDQLGQLEIVLETQLKNSDKPQDIFELKKIEENDKWFKATSALRESRLFIELTCGKDVADAMDNFGHLTTTIAGKIHKNDGEIFRSSTPQLLTLHDRVRATIRKELDIDGSEKVATSQSNLSSAVPTPAPPNPAAK